jgi:hypothetical protein
MIVPFPKGGARLNGKLRTNLTLTEARLALKSATNPEVISDLRAAIRVANQGNVTVSLATALKI